jgi:hypothetical protein
VAPAHAPRSHARNLEGPNHASCSDNATDHEYYRFLFGQETIRLRRRRKKLQPDC